MSDDKYNSEHTAKPLPETDGWDESSDEHPRIRRIHLIAKIAGIASALLLASFFSYVLWVHPYKRIKTESICIICGSFKCEIYEENYWIFKKTKTFICPDGYVPDNNYEKNTDKKSIYEMMTGKKCDHDFQIFLRQSTITSLTSSSNGDSYFPHTIPNFSWTHFSEYQSGEKPIPPEVKETYLKLLKEYQDAAKFFSDLQKEK